MRIRFEFFLLLSLLGPAHAELQVQRVWPERIYYKPGERAVLSVTVANPALAAASARLSVELIHDLDTAVPLAAQEITIEPGKTFTWQRDWKTQPWLGIELRATLGRDGAIIERRSDYFTCAGTLWQVMMAGRGDHGGLQFAGTIDDRIAKYAGAFPGQWRSQYGNFIEQFGWGPSDFDCLTPKTDRWWSGQGSYSMSKPNLLAVYHELHRQGIEVITYGKAAAGGVIGYENLRRRPELAGYTDGRPWLENYSAAYLDFMATLGPPKPGDKQPVPGTPQEMEKAGYTGAGWYAPYTPGRQNWCSVWYSCTHPDVLEVGIRELRDSATMFGFDGVRFDGEFSAERHQTLDGSYVGKESFDAEAANVALVQRMKAEIWKAHPGYLFGYNTTTPITWSIAANNTPARFREKCQDGGLVANESLAFPGDVPWLDYARLVRREAELVRYYGGFHATYAFDRAGNRPYNYIINFALGSHVYNWYDGPVFDNADFNRFGARFAALLWDRHLRYWPAAEHKVTVTAARPLWWQPFAAARPLPGGSTQFILHLINPPAGKTVLAKPVLPSAPARDVTVAAEAPNAFIRAVLVNFPSCAVQPLEPKREGGNLIFNLAQIPYWAMLVLEAKTPAPAPVYDQAPAAATVSTPSAQDLQIAPKTTAPGKPSWRDVVEPDNWGGGEAVAERVKDPDALNGGAVRGKPNAPTGGMANTYSYPRIPGEYRATFRLKVADNTVDQPVFNLNIDDWVMHPLPGVPKLPNPTRVVKATDFKQPNVYQEFTVPFAHADMGFLGVDCTYLGHVAGSWDRAVLELVEPWSEQRLAEHYRGMAAPENLRLQRGNKLDVLVVRGLWDRLYHIEDALKLLPGKTAITDAYTSFHPQQDTQLSGFKLDWGPLFTQDAIVLANVETRGLGLGQVRMVEGFVRQGGGLLILGGLTTLGQTDNMKGGWPEFLPVTLNGPWEIRKCIPPARVAGSEPGPPAVVLYRHMVSPKPGSTVLLQGAKGEPLLVGRPYGKGRVAVFTGTVLGESGAGQTAFWTSAAWPHQLAHALTWVTARTE